MGNEKMLNDKLVSLFIIEFSYRVVLTMIFAWSLFIILNLDVDTIGIKFYLACFFILNLIIEKNQVS